MKQMVKKCGKAVGGAALAVGAAAGQAAAAVDLTGITIDTTGPEDLAKMILPALFVMWAIRKLIKLTNRS
ncbi:hypothetical protein KOM00_09970 [Geomonas sp. Red69]|uniref:hypothetical protein n=1 Tax=Geomonas diazotrophica TaxID=2843197 RepID=UPI001C107C16|nr:MULTISPECIES: hypothetical protein [Geomonas]MBU5637059.1 hypothetical protein [Geomonas diazotrophica]QXE88535.1 hypothetical protein KP003_09110 [Geomonas nitrogeniifigens]